MTPSFSPPHTEVKKVKFGLERIYGIPAPLLPTLLLLRDPSTLSLLLLKETSCLARGGMEKVCGMEMGFLILAVTRRPIDLTWLWMQQGRVMLPRDASSKERQVRSWGGGGEGAGTPSRFRPSGLEGTGLLGSLEV